MTEATASIHIAYAFTVSISLCLVEFLHAE